MRSPRSAPLSLVVSTALLCVGLVLAGCGERPAPTLALKISDGDWQDYDRSLELIAGRQTAAERVEFAKSLQELRYQAMAGERKSPGQELNAALRKQIAGRAVRDVLVLGYTIKLDRKQEEEKALRRSIWMNRRLHTKPGDDNSADYLESVRSDQAKQLVALRKEISALEQRFQELDPTRSRARPAVVPGEELDEKPELKKPGKPF